MATDLDLKKHSKYFFILSFVAIIILSLYLIRPFIVAVSAGIVLSYIFYPVYKIVNRVIKNKNISSILVSLLVILIILIPILFAANAVINESVKFFYSVRDIDLGGTANKIAGYFGENIDINSYLEDILNKFSVGLLQSVSNFIFSLPQKLLSAFIIIFVMFYAFKEGEGWVETFKNELPLKEKYREDLFKKFSDVVHATMFGVVITGVIQGAVGALGLWIFGVPSPLLLGIVMTILAMIPFFGAWLVWLPIAILNIVRGDSFNGIGLLIYGLLIISVIDNIVRPKIIGSRAKIHPVIILLGVLGGLYLFGLVGLIIGPLILAILTVFFELYISEQHSES